MHTSAIEKLNLVRRAVTDFRKGKVDAEVFAERVEMAVSE